MVAGTSSDRITVASRPIAIARPRPSSFTITTFAVVKARPTTTRIEAAEVMIGPVATRPIATASRFVAPAR